MMSRPPPPPPAPEAQRFGVSIYMASTWLLCSVCTRTLEVGDIKKCRQFFFRKFQVVKSVYK